MDYIYGKHITTMPKLVPMIMAALTPPKHSFVYIDEEIEDIDFNMADVDFVAITAMTVQANRAYEIADVFRKRGVKVAIGGIHASVLPDEAAQHADAVCLGEGENIWPAMLEDLESGALKPRYEAKDYPPVTKLISPRVDAAKHEYYSIFPVMASKGCPYDCDFCSIKYSSGYKIRMKPVEQVIGEIRELEKLNHEAYKKTYQFVDDNLYINRGYLMDLLAALKGLHINWNAQGTLNTAMDDEVLRLMAEAGCRGYCIGFESISKACLKEANKEKTNQVELYGLAVENLSRHGIAPSGFFIYGFDNDDKNIFNETLRFIGDINLIDPYFSVLTPYPGTRLYDRVKHRIFDRNWSHYNAVTCVFTPEQMTPEELDTGTYGAGIETANLNTVKRQFDKFWSRGPWRSTPPFTLKERITLLLISLKLSLKKEYRDYAGFLIWAAAHKNAVNLFALLQAIFFADMAKKVTNIWRNSDKGSGLDVN